MIWVPVETGGSSAVVLKNHSPRNRVNFSWLPRMMVGNTVEESRKGKPVGNHENRERIEALLLMRLSHLGFMIDRHLQFPHSFPYDVLGHHTVVLAVDDVRVSASGIAAKVSVSIEALLDYPPLRARRAGELVPRRTDVKEFKGTVQIQARDPKIEEFGDLELVPHAKLLSWPDDL